MVTTAFANAIIAAAGRRWAIRPVIHGHGNNQWALCYHCVQLSHVRRAGEMLWDGECHSTWQGALAALALYGA